jgi:hypothetical protein
VDFGLIGTSLTAERCGGQDGYLAPEQLPAPTQVDNRGGDASASSTEAPIAGPFGAGSEEAAATTQPASRAVSVSAPVGLSPAFVLDGGRAVAETQVLPDGREAVSTVEASLDLGGVVRLDSMRWTARHHTGVAEDVSGAFSIGALELLGVPIPGDAAAPAIDAVNAALAPSGLRIELPVVERLTEPVDLVRVTPLRIVVEDSQLGATAVRPGLDASREIRSQLFDALVQLDCGLANFFLIGEISLGVASGTGALVIDIGGVEARSEELVVEDAFGTQLPAATPSPLPAQPIPLASAPEPALPPVVAAPTAPTAPSAMPTAQPVRGERRCESVHSFSWPSCSEGAAGAVGVIGAAATAAAAVLDFRRRRGAPVTAA